MPFKSTVTLRTLNTGYQYNDYKNQFWERSPHGEPHKANPMSVQCTRTQFYVSRNYSDPTNSLGGLALHTNQLWENNAYEDFAGPLRVTASNRAYAALVQAVKSGDAGLGVTLASYKQTYAMITLRANMIRKLARKAEITAEQINLSRRRRKAEWRRAKRRNVPTKWRPADFLPVGSANIFLEGLFGWLPLYGSIVAGMEVLTGDTPYELISRSRKVSKKFPWQEFPGFDPGFLSQECMLTVRCNQSAAFRINNPNAWLANQMGLINPAVVAWDLVPWSFVVNMFVNVNSLLNQFTDFYGLEVSGSSTTTREDYFETSVFKKILWGGQPYYIQDTRILNNYRKSRTIGLTLPQLEFRLPPLSLSSAVMATSLMVQQITGLKYIKTLNARKS